MATIDKVNPIEKLTRELAESIGEADFWDYQLEQVRKRKQLQRFEIVPD